MSERIERQIKVPKEVSAHLQTLYREHEIISVADSRYPQDGISSQYRLYGGFDLLLTAGDDSRRFVARSWGSVPIEEIEGVIIPDVIDIPDSRYTLLSVPTDIVQAKGFFRTEPGAPRDEAQASTHLLRAREMLSNRHVKLTEKLREEIGKDVELDDVLAISIDKQALVYLG